jgi:hypothetical protein
MPRHRLAVALGAASLVAAACSGGVEPPAQTASPAPTPAVAGVTATPLRTAEPPPTIAPTPIPTESLVEPFDPAAFGDDSATVTNPWLPLAPGTRWVHEGEATIDGERLERRVELTVTDLVKEIAGIRTVVAFEQDYNEDELVESELVFWAQDASGAVWRLGEYPEAWEDGVIVETPIWIHGFEEAAAGIAMKADAAVFGPSYSQGWGPAVDWTDRGRVFETGSATCVPVDCYEDVLVIDEFNPDEPDTHQLKYYAPGVGVVRVGWAGAREEEQEVLELVEFVRLGPAQLAQIRAKALEQDARGYANSPEVYARTPPAE